MVFSEERIVVLVDIYLVSGMKAGEHTTMWIKINKAAVSRKMNTKETGTIQAFISRKSWAGKW